MFRYEAQDVLSAESLQTFDDLVQDTAMRLRKLGDLEATPEKMTEIGLGIDYEGETLPASVRVLLVEDNPADARLAELHLQESGGFEVTHVASLSEALDCIAARRFDIVLLDLALPDAMGTSSFQAVRAAAPDIPVVILTGLDDRAFALSLVHSGAQDYLVKGDLGGPLMGRSLRYALERHRLRAEVDAAQRQESELKDRFLSHVSHELRSPLAVSFLYTTNLMDGLAGELTPEQHEHLAVAVDALRAQMRLVDDLLATVRSDASLINVERSRVSISQLIAETIAGFGSTANGVTVLFDDSGELPQVHVDANRIRQVLTNLIDNALKFSPPDSKVRVRVYPAADDPGFLRVDVTDRGRGISESSRARIFDRLYQGNTEHPEGARGLGLGLYLCRLLVERHGGRIWVEPGAERGSRFSFTLPFLQSAGRSA